MKLLATLFAAAAAVASARTAVAGAAEPVPVNGCVTFTVSAGTGCAWMCNYCANTLGTNNYYFTTDVCTYQQGAGCVGNPLAGVPYTCCTAGDAEEEVLEAVDEDEDEGEGEGEWNDDDSCEDYEADVDTAAAADIEIWIIKVRGSKA